MHLLGYSSGKNLKNLLLDKKCGEKKTGRWLLCDLQLRPENHVGVLELHCTEVKRPPVQSGLLGKSRRRSDRPGWLDTIRYVWHAPVDDPGSSGPTHCPSSFGEAC